MSDNLVFALSGYLEEDLFALPVMMHYLSTRVVVSRDPESVTLICPNEDIHKLADAYWKDIIVVKEPTSEVVDKADLMFDFDSEEAYRISEKLQKHLGEAYGIQLGVGLTRILPPILVEDVPEVPGTLLVVERNHKDRAVAAGRWEHAREFITIGKEQKIPIEYLYSVASYDQTRRAVGRSTVIVGPRSTATLIAAAAGKIVFELSFDTQHAQFMSKWENKNYKPVHGKLSEMTAELVWAGLLQFIREIKQPKKVAA